MHCNKINIFIDAVSNEIDIDKNIIRRLGRNDLEFTPIRSLITLNYIDKYNVSKFFYGVLGLIFFSLSPFYFLFMMFKFLFKRKYIPSSGTENIILKDVVLVANRRVISLMDRVNTGQNYQFININQLDIERITQIHQLLRLRDYFYAYFYAICGMIYLYWELKDKKDILQGYVAYEWFLVYLGLSASKGGIKSIYLANHYDRWAVMFDQLYASQQITLLQHGILPNNLQLSYKLKNINEILTFDDHSENIFKKMFECSKTKFGKLDMSLLLVDVKKNKKTILIIGQPQSVGTEIKLATALSNSFDIFVKPHPLYSHKEYNKLHAVTIIQDVNYYPRVDVVLCYESTLGREYEYSGVEVIWWKGMKIKDIIFRVNKALRGSVDN